MSRITQLAALTLALGVGVLPANAQDGPPPAPPAGETELVRENSPDALATAARNILELVESHNFRMRRIDSAVGYFASISDQDKLRQFSLLREREQNQYQQTLETYRRLLGDEDFARVAGLLRNHFELAGERAAARPDGDDARTRAEAERDSAAQRAERVRRMMAAQVEEARELREAQAALERNQVIARMRASERSQLAQRLALARATQLEARAAAARRYQPLPESPSQRRADPSRGGFPGGPGGGGRGQRGPWQTPQRR